MSGANRPVNRAERATSLCNPLISLAGNTSECSNSSSTDSLKCNAASRCRSAASQDQQLATGAGTIFSLCRDDVSTDKSVSSHARNYSGSMSNLRRSSRTRNGSIDAPLSSQTVSGFSRDSGKVYLIRGSYDSPTISQMRRDRLRRTRKRVCLECRCHRPKACNGGRIGFCASWNPALRASGTSTALIALHSVNAPPPNWYTLGGLSSGHAENVA